MKRRRASNAYVLTAGPRKLSLIEQALLSSSADQATAGDVVVGLAARVPAIAKKYSRWIADDEKWLSQLAAQRRVPTGNYRALALALARELYPASRKRGPEEKWTELALGVLLAEVELLIEGDSHMSAKDATQQLAKAKHWALFIQKKDRGTSHVTDDPGEALRRAYQRVRKMNLSFFRDVAAEMRRKDPAKWNELVRVALSPPLPRRVKS